MYDVIIFSRRNNPIKQKFDLEFVHNSLLRFLYFLLFNLYKNTQKQLNPSADTDEGTDAICYEVSRLTSNYINPYYICKCKSEKENGPEIGIDFETGGQLLFRVKRIKIVCTERKLAWPPLPPPTHTQWHLFAFSLAKLTIW